MAFAGVDVSGSTVFQWAFGWNRVFVFCLFIYLFFCVCMCVDYPFSGFLTRWQTLSELIFWSMHAGVSRLLTSLASSLGCTR